MSRENTGQSNVSLLSNYSYFDAHPENILGRRSQTSDRWEAGKTLTTFIFNTDKNGFEQELNALLETLPSCGNERVAMTSILHTEPNPNLPTVAELQNIENAIAQAPDELTNRKRKGKKEIVFANQVSDSNIWSFDEVDAKYNQHLSKEEIQAFVFWQRSTLNRPMNGGWQKYHIDNGRTDNAALRKIILAGHLHYNGRKFVPTFILVSGDVSDTQDQLNSSKAAIIQVYNECGIAYEKATELYERSRTLVAEAIDKTNAKKLHFLADTDENGALLLDPTSELVRNIKINDISLLNLFLDWAKQNPNSFTISNFTDMYSLAVERRRRGQDEAAGNYTDKRSAAFQEMKKLFALYMNSFAGSTIKAELENTFHSKYNSTVEPDLNCVPIGFAVSALTPDGGTMSIKKEKREAIAKAVLEGALCVAYGVGLGKTWCAAFIMAQFIENGWAKRALLTVPLQVYKQFLNELRSLLPFMQVVSLRNLDAPNLAKAHQFVGKKQAEKMIFVCTHEGFMKIGLSDKYHNDYVDILQHIKSNNRKKSETQDAIDEKTAYEKLGRSLRGAAIYIDDMEVDFFAMDEAHAAKKIYTTVQSGDDDDGGDTKKYAFGQGEPSQIGLRTFIISNYIQKRNKTSNVLLLTATPFTNSPLEIYSFLLVLGLPYLQKKGLLNITTFFDTFAQIEMEMVVQPNLTVEQKQVFKGFAQLTAMQKIIQKFFLYKHLTDDISRPNKLIYPSRKMVANGSQTIQAEQLSSYIPPTPEQATFLGYAKQLISDEKANLKQGKGSTNMLLKAMTIMRLASLSPYLLDKHVPEIATDLPELTYQNLIETSAKLKYVMLCIKSVREECLKNNLPMAGQIIYMPTALEFHELIKEYLVKELGFADYEVGFINGNMKPHEGTKNQVQDKFLGRHFNTITEEYDVIPDEYRVKVLIGSGTITEGLNLQRWGAVIYNCYLEWNPTDAIQLEGRIWRQGNLYNNVRIVYPLVIESMDVFMFQKNGEKRARINAIWDYTGDLSAVDLSDYSPEEIMFSLISDINVLLAIDIDRDVIKIGVKKKVFLSNTSDRTKGMANGYNLLKDIFLDYFHPNSQEGFWEIAIANNVLSKKLALEQTDQLKKIYQEAEKSKLSFSEKIKAIFRQMRTFSFSWQNLANRTNEAIENGGKLPTDAIMPDAQRFLLIGDDKSRSFPNENLMLVWDRYGDSKSNSNLFKAVDFINTLKEIPTLLLLFKPTDFDKIVSVWDKFEKRLKNDGYDVDADGFERYQESQKKTQDDILTEETALLIEQDYVKTSKKEFEERHSEDVIAAAKKRIANRIVSIRARQEANNANVNLRPLEEIVEDFTKMNYILSNFRVLPSDCKWGAGQQPRAKMYRDYMIKVDTDGGMNRKAQVLEIFPRQSCTPIYRVRFANGYEDFINENEFVEIPTPKKLSKAATQKALEKIYFRALERKEALQRMGEKLPINKYWVDWEGMAKEAKMKELFLDFSMPHNFHSVISSKLVYWQRNDDEIQKIKNSYGWGENPMKEVEDVKVFRRCLNSAICEVANFIIHKVVSEKKLLRSYTFAAGQMLYEKLLDFQNNNEPNLYLDGLLPNFFGAKIILKKFVEEEGKKIDKNTKQIYSTPYEYLNTLIIKGVEIGIASMNKAIKMLKTLKK